MSHQKSSRLFPPAPIFAKLIGPSLILLGLGLGSGEVILWPYLVSNYGLGVIWAGVFGITLQFFVNMEIERYSLIRGESIFVGFRRLWHGAPYWFLISTFVCWIWPGIIAYSAKIIASLFGISHFEYLAMAFLLLIGLILTLGPRVYKTVEGFQKIIIGLSVPTVFLLALFLAKGADWQALVKGVAGIGDNYHFLPKGIDLFVFISALAYSGAGGNLNLSQSFYIKEKGYGMCYGTKGISSVLTGKAERIELEGKAAEHTIQNHALFRKWWKAINLEHLIVFLLTGIFLILMLALLAYATMKGTGLHLKDVDFILAEGKNIGSRLAPWVGVIFLAIAGIVLFATQFTVLDSTSRIMSENAVILRPKANLSKVYYSILWLQILAGIIIFALGYTNPLTLVVIGAVLNAMAMFVHIALTYALNRKLLPEAWQASWPRLVVLFIGWLLFGGLTIFAIIDGLRKLSGS